MKILKIVGASAKDECKVLGDVLAIWERGGACSVELMKRLPNGRVEVHVAADDDDGRRAIIVIENGVVGVHPLDEPGSAIRH